MYCLIEKETNRIVQDAILESGQWLGQGVVCWAPCLYCNEGEEDQAGYYTAEVDDDELWDAQDEWLDRELYYLNGHVSSFPDDSDSDDPDSDDSDPDDPDLDDPDLFDE